MSDFKNKIIVITGGANGIGRCLTRTFAELGAHVAFLDIDREAGEMNLLKLKELGSDALFYHGDAADKAALEGFAASIKEKYGRADILVNNACKGLGGILSGCSYEDFDYVLRLGVAAPYWLTKLLLPLFGKDAAVINISSTRAEMSQADTESYTAAKGGISALTHGLAMSLSGKVRVNGIAPGWIEVGPWHDENFVPSYTGADLLQHPSGRVGDPTDIARTAVFLADPRNSFINGQILTVDGGMTKKMIYAGDEGWSLYTP
ncbi:MAG: SDR family oxidoreductase [Oscillospiraceae bacterium]|nr:SDR family oxidoreductase [Oscillospiraceae bacterium]